MAEHSAFNLLRISTYGDKKIRLEWFGTQFVKFPKQSIKIHRLLLCLRGIDFFAQIMIKVNDSGHERDRKL